MDTQEIIFDKEYNRKWYDKVSDYFYDLWRYSRIRDWYRQIVNRLFNKYYLIDTGLSRGHWHDTDQKILYGMMALLKEFVEEEKPFEFINWDSDDQHQNAKKEMVAIYEWWLNYEKRVEENDKALHEWSLARFPGGGDFLKELNAPDTVESKNLFDIHTEMEKKLDDEEEEMLMRMIKIRHFLWT